MITAKCFAFILLFVSFSHSDQAKAKAKSTTEANVTNTTSELPSTAALADASGSTITVDNSTSTSPTAEGANATIANISDVPASSPAANVSYATTTPPEANATVPVAADGVTTVSTNVTDATNETAAVTTEILRSLDFASAPTSGCSYQYITQISTKELSSRTFLHIRVASPNECARHCQRHPFCLSAGYQTEGDPALGGFCFLSYFRIACTTLGEKSSVKPVPTKVKELILYCFDNDTCDEARSSLPNGLTTVASAGDSQTTNLSSTPPPTGISDATNQSVEVQLFGDDCSQVLTRPCYAVHPQAKTFDAAVAHCKKDGGHLPFLFSKKEQDAFEELRRKHHLLTTTLWLGSSDNGTEGKWHWTDEQQTALSDTLWAAGEPSGKQLEDCLVLGSKETAHFQQWYDDVCTKQHKYVCIVGGQEMHSALNVDSGLTVAPREESIKTTNLPTTPESNSPSTLLTLFMPSTTTGVTKSSTTPVAEQNSTKASDENVTVAEPVTIATSNVSATFVQSSIAQDAEIFGADCTDPSLREKRPCFAAHMLPTTLLEATNECKKEGGHLPFIHSARAQNALQHLRKLHRLLHTPLWVGATDSGKEGTWVWQDKNQTLVQDFPFWAPGEPSGKQHCLSVGSPSTNDFFHFFDESCDSKMAYFCIFDNSSIAETEHDPDQQTNATQALTTAVTSDTTQSSNTNSTTTVEPLLQQADDTEIFGAYGTKCSTAKAGDPCFKVFKTEESYRDSRHRCKEGGGHLPFIYTKVEQELIDRIRAKFTEISTSPLWAGGINTDIDGNFRWHDENKTNLTFTNWAPDEPNGVPSRRKDACIVVGSQEKSEYKLWYDEPCDDKYAFMCIYENRTSANERSAVRGSDVSESTTIVTVAVSAVVGTAPIPCSDGQLPPCFTIYAEAQTLRDAAHQCRSIGGHLPFLYSEKEQNDIEQIRSSNFSLVASIPIWTGGLSGGKLDQWIWNDGNRTKVTFNNWASSEPSGLPSDSKEACIVVGSREKAEFTHWYDEPCDEKYPFICFVDAKGERTQTTPAGVVDAGATSISVKGINVKVDGNNQTVDTGETPEAPGPNLTATTIVDVEVTTKSETNLNLSASEHTTIQNKRADDLTAAIASLQQFGYLNTSANFSSLIESARQPFPDDLVASGGTTPAPEVTLLWAARYLRQFGYLNLTDGEIDAAVKVVARKIASTTGVTKLRSFVQKASTKSTTGTQSTTKSADSAPSSPAATTTIASRIRRHLAEIQ